MAGEADGICAICGATGPMDNSHLWLCEGCHRWVCWRHKTAVLARRIEVLCDECERSGGGDGE